MDVVLGHQRNLSRINLGLLRVCAEAAECSKPKITSTQILKITNAYLFKLKYPHLVVAGEKYLKVLHQDPDDGLHIQFKIQTPTNVTSLLFTTTQQTLLFGTDLVYELDLQSGQVEEFMDKTDRSLQINLANCTQFKQYPLAILDLTTKNPKKNAIIRKEYLVAFPDFGIFLDEHGRRARDLDIIWSKLPSCIGKHLYCLLLIHESCKSKKSLLIFSSFVSAFQNTVNQTCTLNTLLASKFYNCVPILTQKSVNPVYSCI